MLVTLPLSSESFSVSSVDGLDIPIPKDKVYKGLTAHLVSSFLKILETIALTPGLVLLIKSTKTFSFLAA